MIRTTLLAALTLAAPPVAAAAQPVVSMPVAYFSPQRAFAASPEGKDADAKLSAMQNLREKELQARNRKLSALRAALDANTGILSATARQEREREIDRFQVDIQRFVQDAQAQFLGVRRQSEDAFLVRLRPALEAVVKEKGLLFVINEDQGLLAWADPAADITPEVIKRLSPQVAR